MTRLELDPRHWTPELRYVLFALSVALAKREATPELVASLHPYYENAVAEHRADIEYFPEGYTDDPLELPEYAVNLAGDRVKASWLLLENDLYAFCEARIAFASRCDRFRSR